MSEEDNKNEDNDKVVEVVEEEDKEEHISTGTIRSGYARVVRDEETEKNKKEENSDIE